MARSHHESEESPSRPDFSDPTHLTRDGFLKACQSMPEQLHETISAHIKALEDTIDDGKADMLRLEEQNKTFQKDLDSLLGELGEKHKRIFTLTTDINILEETVRRMGPATWKPSEKGIKLRPPRPNRWKGPNF